MASPSDELWTLAKRLEESTKRVESVVVRLEGIVNGIAIKRMILQRKSFASTIKLANKDRKMLRRELLELHSLLNEQVKDIQPAATVKKTRNQYL